jgi:hypothetical protein
MRMPGREPLSIAESGGRNRVTAIIAPDRGPSHPRSLHYGSRLPAMSRRGAASSGLRPRQRSGIGLVLRPAGSPLNTRVNLPDGRAQRGA